MDLGYYLLHEIQKEAMVVRLSVSKSHGQYILKSLDNVAVKQSDSLHPAVELVQNFNVITLLARRFPKPKRKYKFVVT